MKVVDNPAIMVWVGSDNKPMFAIHARHGLNSPAHFGLVIADLVRHIAQAFGCSEEVVWAWVDAERQMPTTKITQVTN